MRLPILVDPPDFPGPFEPASLFLVGALVGGSVHDTSKSDIEIGPSFETVLNTTNGLIAHKTLAAVWSPVGFKKGSIPE